MRKNRLLSTGLAFMLTAALLTGCGNQAAETNNTGSNQSSTIESGSSSASASDTTTSGAVNGTLNIGSGTVYLSSDDLAAAAVTVSDDYTLRTVEYKSKDLEADYSDATIITLSGNDATISGKGATLEKAEGNDGISIIRITKKGEYKLTGSFNGQIIIDADAEKDVCLLLDGVSITCDKGPAIYAPTADKLVITTAAGSENVLTMTADAEKYAPNDESSDDMDAVIYTKTNLTLNGTGTLRLVSGWKHGIHSTKTLKLISGNISIESADSGIKVKNAIIIRDGNITITSGGDGIKCTNSEDETKGYIFIEGGNIAITSATDGIQAETALEITGGSLSINSGSGSANASKKAGNDNPGWGFWGNSSTSQEDKESAKGLKGGSIYIKGGSITVDSSDDALHSNGDCIISGGYLDILSGDDGIHADKTLTINSGNVIIEKSYEGLEAGVITINGGAIQLVASDDGLNAAGGSDDASGSTSSSTESSDTGNSFFGGFGKGGFGGMGGFGVETGSAIIINGGTLIVNAAGDGLDSNDTLTINGGQVLVAGPEDNGNGPVDFGSAGIMNGGTLIAYGSSGMVENFDSSSTQPVVTYYFSSTVAAGTDIAVYDSSNNEVLSFTTIKSAQCVIMSSDQFKDGETYTLAATGYSDSTFTVSGIISSAGSSNGGFGGFGGKGNNTQRPDGNNGDRGGFGGKGQRPDNSGNGSNGGFSDGTTDGNSGATTEGNNPGFPDGTTPPEGMDFPNGMTPPDGTNAPDGMTPPNGTSGTGSDGSV